MLQLYAILIVGLAHAAEAGYVLDPDTAALARGWGAAAFAWGGMALVAAWFALVMRRCAARFDQEGRLKWVDLADRALAGGQWGVLIVHGASVQVFGWMGAAQDCFGGNVILLDLVLAILPPLAGLTLLWLLHEPMARRLRDAITLDAATSGRAVPRPRSRWDYLLLQWRVNILFILVPLLIIITIGDVVDALYGVGPDSSRHQWQRDVLTLGGAAVVFLFAPLLARVVLGLRPMPDPDVRQALLQVCRDHRVGVRDVLLWDTHGSMINGAVMGLIGPLRYVILTDALLQAMRPAEVIAVMAHEVGHARRHHLPWLIACLFALILAPSLVLDFALRAVDASNGGWLLHGVMAGVVLLAFVGFGWISRRFEGQADAFAAQHLSGLREARGEHDEGAVITSEAVTVTAQALRTVSLLHGINPRRSSWRHGSIAWRQRNLRRLAGSPLRSPPIDRVVRRIKLAAAIVLAASIAVAAYDTWRNGPSGGFDNASERSTRGYDDALPW